MTHDVHTLSGAYALDALTHEEAAAFEEHLEGCAVCRDEVRELREAVAAMGAQTWAAAPRSLRESVLAAAERTPQDRPPARVEGTDELASRRRRSPVMLLVAAVAIVAAAVGGLVGVRALQGDDQTELAAAARAVFNASDSSQVAVKTSNGGTLHVAVSPERLEMAVDVRDLPALDRAHVYQLWAVHDGEMANAAVLANDTTGAAMGMPAQGTTIAVTVEPSGGSEQPTTQPIASVDPASL